MKLLSFIFKKENDYIDMPTEETSNPEFLIKIFILCFLPFNYRYLCIIHIFRQRSDFGMTKMMMRDFWNIMFMQYIVYALNNANDEGI